MPRFSPPFDEVFSEWQRVILGNPLGLPEWIYRFLKELAFKILLVLQELSVKVLLVWQICYFDQIHSRFIFGILREQDDFVVECPIDSGIDYQL